MKSLYVLLILLFVSCGETQTPTNLTAENNNGISTQGEYTYQAQFLFNNNIYGGKPYYIEYNLVQYDIDENSSQAFKDEIAAIYAGNHSYTEFDTGTSYKGINLKFNGNINKYSGKTTTPPNSIEVQTYKFD